MSSPRTECYHSWVCINNPDKINCQKFGFPLTLVPIKVTGYGYNNDLFPKLILFKFPKMHELFDMTYIFLYFIILEYK